MTETTNTKNGNTLRLVMIVGLVLVAFFGAYRFATARGGQATVTSTGSAVAGTAGATAQGTAQPAVASQPAAGATGAAPDGGSGSACACCDNGASTANGVTGPPSEGAAALEGGVQKISVDVTTVYNPNTIKLKAGVPAEITFSQAQGCTQVVQSPDLGFNEDLSAGPRTVKLQALKPGTYAFSCGMQMVFGQIVVE